MCDHIAAKQEVRAIAGQFDGQRELAKGICAAGPTPPTPGARHFVLSIGEL